MFAASRWANPESQARFAALPDSRTSGSLGEARRRVRGDCFQPNGATGLQAMATWRETRTSRSPSLRRIGRFPADVRLACARGSTSGGLQRPSPRRCGPVSATNASRDEATGAAQAPRWWREMVRPVELDRTSAAICRSCPRHELRTHRGSQCVPSLSGCRRESVSRPHSGGAGTTVRVDHARPIRRSRHRAQSRDSPDMTDGAARAPWAAVSRSTPCRHRRRRSTERRGAG